VLLALLVSGLAGRTNAGPYSGLIQGQDGMLYGTTYDGGDSSYGTTYGATTNGVFLQLYSFTNGLDGSYPVAGLIQGDNGNFYGTTTWGGSNSSGTVFQMLPNGAVTPLYSFTGGHDGDSPYGALAQGSDGNFYGTTAFGGSNSLGVIFKMTPGGIVTPLHSFTGANDGAYPYAGLMQGADGSLYGTTAFGGTHDAGSIFRITPAGSITRLYSFTGGDDGAYPLAGLVHGYDGNLYGTTYQGGSEDIGTVFKISTNGALNSLHSFSDTDGALPSAGLAQGRDGNLYGTTELGGVGQFGTVFRITTNGVLDTIIHFTAANGAYPEGALVQAADGYFYGTTSHASTYDYGYMFRFGPPQIAAQSSNVVAFLGANLAFTVSLSRDSAMPLFYQWQKDQVNLSDGGHYSGCTTPTLTITGTDANDTASYQCVVTNSFGSVTSIPVTLTLNDIGPPCIEIANADFETGFNLAGGGYIATNWTEWEGISGGAIGYDEATIVHGGSHSQRIRISGGTDGTSGGVYQRVTATVRQPYTISAWMYAGDSLTTCSLGVDPTGGTDPNSGVTWSLGATNVGWVQRTLTGTAAADFITVYYRVSTTDNVKRNGYFDDGTPVEGSERLELMIQRNGNSATLVWPICPDAHLERADSLTAPVAWTTVTNSVSIVAGQKNVVLAPAGGTGYFRLVLE
jgi:uncharacterized repeat protein (TIGR03803 family)